MNDIVRQRAKEMLLYENYISAETKKCPSPALFPAAYVINNRIFLSIDSATDWQRHTVNGNKYQIEIITLTEAFKDYEDGKISIESIIKARG